MNQLVLSGPAVSDFLTCRGRTELVDETGAVIGFFEPKQSQDPALQARARQLISDDELNRRRQEKGEITTTEVWKRIAELERDRLARQETARS